jgi:hypothetical protein
MARQYARTKKRRSLLQKASITCAPGFKLGAVSSDSDGNDDEDKENVPAQTAALIQAAEAETTCICQRRRTVEDLDYYLQLFYIPFNIRVCTLGSGW